MNQVPTIKTDTNKDSIQQSAFDIFTDIHRNDSCMIDEELKCLTQILDYKKKSNSIKLNDTKDAKLLLFKYENSFHKSIQGNSLKQSVVNTKRLRFCLTKKIRKKINYKMALNETSRNLKNINVLNSFNLKTIDTIKPYVRAKELNTQSRILYLNNIKRLRHNSKLINKLDKIINFPTVNKEKRSKEIMEKSFWINKNRIFEDYKYERMKQRQAILDSIDTDNLKWIQPWYRYKFESIESYERQKAEIEQQLVYALANPKPMFAKSPKKMLMKEKLRDLLRSKL